MIYPQPPKLRFCRELMQIGEILPEWGHGVIVRWLWRNCTRVRVIAGQSSGATGQGGLASGQTPPL